MKKALVLALAGIALAGQAAHAVPGRADRAGEGRRRFEVDRRARDARAQSGASASNAASAEVQTILSSSNLRVPPNEMQILISGAGRSTQLHADIVAIRADLGNAALSKINEASLRLLAQAQAFVAPQGGVVTPALLADANTAAMATNGNRPVRSSQDTDATYRQKELDLEATAGQAFVSVARGLQGNAKGFDAATRTNAEVFGEAVAAARGRGESYFRSLLAGRDALAARGVRLDLAELVRLCGRV